MSDDKMTREEAFDILDKHAESMETKRQQYAEVMGDNLSYHGESILKEMENNGESWQDVDCYKIGHGKYENVPFHIWTTNFIYFPIRIAAGIPGMIYHIKSIPRNPRKDVIPKWLN